MSEYVVKVRAPSEEVLGRILGLMVEVKGHGGIDYEKIVPMAHDKNKTRAKTAGETNSDVIIRIIASSPGKTIDRKSLLSIFRTQAPDAHKNAAHSTIHNMITSKRLKKVRGGRLQIIPKPPAKEK